jgi:hypothetical protein
MRENRETPLVSGSGRVGPAGEGASHTASRNASGESDERVVPAKRSNKEEQSSAESVEGSGSTKGNTEETHTDRTQRREQVSQGLGGVREAARREKKQKFTALLHHVTTELLRDSYQWLKKQAAPGVDGVTWQQYGEGLEEKLQDLHDRIHKGAYRAQPSRRRRSQHDALDALVVGLRRKKVNWILDLDVRGFFDNVSRQECRKKESGKRRR